MRWNFWICLVHGLMKLPHGINADWTKIVFLLIWRLDISVVEPEKGYWMAKLWCAWDEDLHLWRVWWVECLVSLVMKVCFHHDRWKIYFIDGLYVIYMLVGVMPRKILDGWMTCFSQCECLEWIVACDRHIYLSHCLLSFGARDKVD